MSPLRRSLAAAAALVATGPAAALAQPAEPYYYHHDMMGGWIVGPILMLLFLGLVVGAVVAAVRLLGYGPGARPPSGRALEILGERFARGEIDRAEYEERRSALIEEHRR